MITLVFSLSALLLAILVFVWIFPRPKIGFSLLLLLLPIHTLFFQILRVELRLSSSISILLQSWKDVLLLLLLGWILAKGLSTGKLRFPKASIWLIPTLFLLLFVGIFSLAQSQDYLSGLYSLRGTFEPFLVLALALFLPINITWLQKLLPRLIIIGVLVAGFSIFQSLVLGYPFVLKYYAIDGNLPTSFSFMGGSFQRAMGSFSSPNQLSLYLSFLIILIINQIWRFPRKNRLYVIAVLILFSALLLTASRSGWVALFAGFGVSFVLWRRKQKTIMIGIGMTLVFLVILFGFGLDEWLLNTVTGREISANYHLSIFLDNLKTIWENPLGVGPGNVGARAYRFGTRSSNINYYATESFLMQFGLEYGMLGIIIFLAILILASMNIYRNIFQISNRWLRGVAVSGLSFLPAALVHSLLIPDLQDMAVSSYLWFFVGISLRLPALERLENKDLIEVVQNKSKLDYAAE